MSARYAPLPSHRPEHDSNGELEAAFDDSDDEDASESHPLNPPRRSSPQQPAPIPGSYDFECVDYDVPPPGSPTRAMANDFGNTNGLVPSFNTNVDITRRDPIRGGWFRRAAASILPSHYVDRLGLPPQHQRLVGGGSSNDGVFANMMAKPDGLRRIQHNDDSIYLAPEETQKDAPPSYSAAQADAVPPYWETTIHLSTSATPIAGEMMVEGLPTGSLFSFLWNMLVSISFQFVGFLLTFLLHTTHSAKLGSRAGLGVTLIQYGFALRSKADYVGDSGINSWNTPTPGPGPRGDDYYDVYNNGTSSEPPTTVDPLVMTDVTTEWLSFFLMTVGWFILLTSLLSFWRVKRWERSILNSPTQESTSSRSQNQETAVFSRIGSALNRHRLSGSPFFRHFSSREEPEPTPPPVQELPTLHPNQSDPELRLAEAYAHEAMLHNSLRAAGFL